MDDRFPCLSIRQPWADLILWNVKDIENRSKVTHFRGKILIHASATKPNNTALAGFENVARKRKFLRKGEAYTPTFGAILGMVDIVDCVTKNDSEWFDGPFGWVISNPVTFSRPIPFKGQVGIFYVPRILLAGSPAARARAGYSHATA